MNKRVFPLCFLLACGSGGGAPKPVEQAPIGNPNLIASPHDGGVIPGADPVASSGAAAPSSQDDEVAAMLERVAKLRKLDATRKVPGIRLDRDALLARLRAHVDKEIPPEAIANEGTFNQLLGQLPATFDYKNAMYDLLKAQLAGYYEPEGGTMLLAGDLEGLMAEATLAHELVHALQDQHFDLKGRMKYQPGKSDAQNALQCLAEGDATSAGMDVIFAKMAPGMSILNVPGSEVVSQIMSGMQTGPGSDSPRFMRATLVAPYVDGMAFVNALRRRGGWAEVDKAWARLPQSTEQILHMDKYDANEAPLEVPAIAKASLGAGWSEVIADTQGELALRVTVGEWLGDDDARASAEHWGGDKSSLLKKGDEVAAALRVRYDESRTQPTIFGEHAYSTILSGMTGKLGMPKLKDPSFACFETRGRAPLAIAHAGRDVVLAAGPAKAADMSKTSDCALLKKWTTEILK